MNSAQGDEQYPLPPSVSKASGEHGPVGVNSTTRARINSRPRVNSVPLELR
uniref:Uncharacterized protein n=1 Tax=Arundo donax TaxID=35708 RepID=A0A0A9AWI4_ARUDO